MKPDPPGGVDPASGVDPDPPGGVDPDPPGGVDPDPTLKKKRKQIRILANKIYNCFFQNYIIITLVNTY